MYFWLSVKVFIRGFGIVLKGKPETIPGFRVFLMMEFITSNNIGSYSWFLTF